MGADQKSVFMESMNKMFSFLMAPIGTAATSVTTSVTSPDAFWSCMTIKEACQEAFKTSSITQSVNSTAKVHHVTKNLMPASERENYYDRLRLDSVIGPLLELAKKVLLL